MAKGKPTPTATNRGNIRLFLLVPLIFVGLLIFWNLKKFEDRATANKPASAMIPLSEMSAPTLLSPRTHVDQDLPAAGPVEDTDPLTPRLVPGVERTDYTMFGADLKIRPFVAKAVGMTEIEVEAVNRLLGDLFKAADRLVIQHTVPDRLRSTPEQKAFRIAPFDASSLLKGFQNDVDALLGEQRSSQLLRSFHDHHYRASFGRLEIHYYVRPPEGNESEARVVYEEVDPATGAPLRRGTNPVEGFEKINGPVSPDSLSN